MNISRTASPNAPGRGLLQLDIYAAVLSGLCVAHCFALPVLITVLALSVPYAENEAVHIGLVLAALPATLWVIYKSYPKQRLFIFTASTGLVLMLVGTFAAPVEALEEPFTVIGALLLGSAHVWHWFDSRAAYRSAGQPGQSEPLR